jgi:thiamine pyrophosphate-dependent acetolactate synthase large subunit-like protein
MQTLSTAQAVVSMLELNGIDTIFCLPGVQNEIRSSVEGLESIGLA